VSAIGSVIDPAVRTVKVRLILSNPRSELRPAMFGTAYFMESRQNVLTVSTTSVVREGDGTMTVWVTSNGYDFQQKTVRLGMEKDSKYPILGGLKPGELVVTTGGVFLSNMLQAIQTE